MPRYYCDYCDTYLTHDSPSVRKQHNAGYKHKANVRSYYQQFEEQQTQSLIDQKIKEHLGQTAAYQVGASFHQHLASLPPNMRGPRLPVLPIGSQPPMNAPMVPGIRPPVMLRPPTATPGYPPGPMPPMAYSRQTLPLLLLVEVSLWDLQLVLLKRVFSMAKHLKPINSWAFIEVLASTAVLVWHCRPCPLSGRSSSCKV
ncbi:hypothetical protein H6P81_002054 [Aristolochia fimbriata]|uniref:U1 small nuclear ribonucleoprotein C n=1 Tax=Aristolochia fimbriata TaxID=158543 RepID=A0AAV7FCI3_ARIFI|nr:hypothetical protein H6P81_002054 [Aristolochia fimbriata]